MNSLPSANLFAKQLRLGISIIKFFCVITFNFICFFFLINCISFCVVGVQSCYKRLASQSAKDIIVPAMPATSFQPQPYDVNNVVFILHNVKWKQCEYYFQGPDFDKIRSVRANHLNPALFTYYKTPLLIHQGHMQWLFDHNGVRYLDLFGGIVTVSVGHCHP